jgi:hypothetical protein
MIKTAAILLVTCFILLGGGPLPAQSNADRLQTIARDRGWEKLRQPDHADHFLYQGWVLNVADLEPVMRASVQLMQGDRLVQGVLTNADGRFLVRIPWSTMDKEPLRLVVQYLGKRAADFDLPLDRDEIIVPIAGDIEVPTVTMQDRIWGGGCGLRPCHYLSFDRLNGPLYRPLDEWLMMHHSEIKHTGRW